MVEMRAAIGLLILSLIATGVHPEQAVLRGHIREVPAESPAAREARHKKVADRRAGPLVIVHRGARAFAPENTLEAFAAAMDYGADGVEVDIQRTADGVLVCFHDSWINRMTDGWGTVREHTYYELLKQKLHAYGTATSETRIATFAALLVLARQRAMMLELDIKEPDVQDDIAQMLDAADMWDHVVAVNDWNSEAIRKNPKLKQLSFKAYLPDGRKDWDPEAVKASIPGPGQWTMVDDPRVATRELKRPPFRHVPLPKDVYEDWQPTPVSQPQNAKELVPSAYVRLLSDRINPNSEAQLMTLLTTRRMERVQPDGSERYRRLRTERILARAWAAQRLGQIGRKSPGLVDLLEYQVANRSLHRDWRYHALDGIYAVRALAALGATESVPVLVQAFTRTDVELRRVADPKHAQYPLSWYDSGVQKRIILALGDLRSDASKKFLQQYLATDEVKAAEIGPTRFEEAARALLHQDLTLDELKALLQSQHSGARGVAIQECLDHPTKERTTALKAVAPWALDLPRAGK